MLVGRTKASMWCNGCNKRELNSRLIATDSSLLASKMISSFSTSNRAPGRHQQAFFIGEQFPWMQIRVQTDKNCRIWLWEMTKIYRYKHQNQKGTKVCLFSRNKKKWIPYWFLSKVIFEPSDIFCLCPWEVLVQNCLLRNLINLKLQSRSHFFEATLEEIHLQLSSSWKHALSDIFLLIPSHRWGGPLNTRIELLTLVDCIIISPCVACSYPQKSFLLRSVWLVCFWRMRPSVPKQLRFNQLEFIVTNRAADIHVWPKAS